MRFLVLLLGGWIFVGGVGTVLLTMLTFYRHFPHEFQGTFPTISNAASYDPTELMFAFGMGSVGLCIAIAWPIYGAYNRRNIALSPAPQLHWFNRLGVLLGLTQGISVFLMAYFSMRISLDAHMAASYGTFIAGSFAFQVDAFGTARWREARGLPPGRLRRLRARLALAVAGLGCFFLYMFITKDSNPFGNHHVTRLVYGASELLFSTASFAYAPLAGLEMFLAMRAGGAPKPR